MRAKSRRKKNKPPSFMVHPKWTGGGPYVVWADAGSRERADAYAPMPLPDDPALFRALYEAVDYVRDLQSRHMGGGGEYAVRNGGGSIVWRSLTDRTSGLRDPGRRQRRGTARDLDDMLPHGLEFTAEERTRIERQARVARKLRALRRGASSAGSHQAPKGLRDPSKEAIMEETRALYKKLGHPFGDRDDWSAFLDSEASEHDMRTLRGALAELRALAKKRRSRDPEIYVPHGSTYGRDYKAFATEVRALLYARGLPKSAVVAAVLRAQAVVHDAWRTGKAPCSVADKLYPAAARASRDPKKTRRRR